jgi:uncharacterized protein (DUF885 family)
MIPQFADMPTATIEDNLFYSSIKLMPSTFLKKQEFNCKYTATINDKLIPQFKKMTAFLKTNTCLASRKQEEVYLWKELYATYAKQWTTTESPDEIHALGLKEVARLNAEMEK